jgi:hypothetical protein
MIVLEKVVGKEGKKWIRESYPPQSNFPMVCRNPACYSPLGILHTDNISETAYFEEGVSRRGKSGSVTCPKCETEHDLNQYLVAGESYDGTDEIPSEGRITLEEMPDALRTGVTSFPRKAALKS